MKKRKILLLIPFAGLVLSGCTFQEGWQTTTKWLDSNIWTPVKTFFENLFNGGKKDEGGGGGGKKPVQVNTGTLENPLSVKEFRVECDKVIDYNEVAAGDSQTNTDYLFYVRAEVISSSAFNDYGEIQYLNMKDITFGSYEITGHYVIVDDSVEDDYSEANSLAGKLVTVKGYACLYHYSKEGKEDKKTYQLSKADNDNKPTVMVVDDKPVESIVSVTGPEQVIQGTTISKKNVTIKVNYTTGGSGNAEIVSIVAPTDELGPKTANVTIKGWDETLHFNYTVIEPLPGDTKTFNVSDLEGIPSTPPTSSGEVADARMTTHQVDPVLSVSVSSGTNTGRVYYRDDVGYQVRLYGSESGKFTANVVAGYVITSAKATICADVSSGWYKAGTETDMSISSSKRSASIGGSANTALYSATITYAPDVAAESVVLGQGESEVSLEMGKAGQQLHATVLPEGASQDVTWESKDTSKVAVSEEGFISPVAVTSEPVEVVATSVSNPSASATCLVTVVEATTTIDHLEITGSLTKTAYNNGEPISVDGLGVEVHYSDETHEPAVAANVEWSCEPANATVGVEEVTITATYQNESASKAFSITVSDKSSMQLAYEAAIALPSGATEAMTFEGTIVAKRANNEWFIQDGAYGIEYYGENADFAVGKRVQVVSTLQKYNGLPETKTITSGTVLGDGSLPNPFVITTVAEQSATNFNVLANVVGTATADWSTYSASTNTTLTVSTSDGNINIYLKSGLFSSLESKIQSVKEGDTVTFTNVVTSIFNNPQIAFCVGSDLTVEAAPVKTIVDIVSSTGPTSAVELNYNFKTSDVTVVVEYDDHSTGNGKVTAINAPTTASGENLTGTVTVEGWSEPVEFTYSVVSGVTYDDATMTAGTNGSACTVNGLNGIKVGTGKNDGNMTITVPKGATRVKLYAVAWKGAAGTIGVEISSGTASVESLTLLADDGLSNNSPFTLVGNLETFVHTFTLSGVSAEATITLSSGTARRFAVWGAQYAL